MNRLDREMCWDLLAGTCAVLAFWSFSWIGKSYNGSYGITLLDFTFLSFLLSSWTLLGALRGFSTPTIYTLVRAWLWLSLLVGLYLRYGAVAIQTWGGQLCTLLCIAILGCGLWVHRYGPVWVWSGLRRVIAIIPALIVASTLLVGAWMSSPQVWLEKGEPKPNEVNKVATIALLFDELNANASQGLQKVLVKRGYQVSFKSINPVNHSTIEVVPEVFTGSDFSGARPCGSTRICANRSALDFAQLYVLRNDVDVVGFHHPYCAISGLRFCQRVTTDRSLLDWALWDCALSRLTGIRLQLDKQACQLKSGQTWVELGDAVEENLLAAPTLKKGGVLYAHLPIPHPPASKTGTLPEQYRSNVLQSEKILEKVLDELAAHRVNARLILFADHPLRQEMWCQSYASLFDPPCVIDRELFDAQVPLIVAAQSDLPKIEGVQSNAEIFDILRAWLKH
jgi:hypothetical protein